MHVRFAAASRARTLTSTASGILFYHRIAEGPDELAVAPQSFEQQMEHLAANGYEVLDVASVWERILDGQADRRQVGICFDDGYSDVAVNGLPVLEAHGFGATVFIATGVTSGSATFAWYIEQPPLLSWDEIVELDARGTLKFEPHTVTHPNLLALDDAEARREIDESKRSIEERLGRMAAVFCYPAGLFGERERSYVSEAGFDLAVSCEPGLNDSHTDPLALRRVQVDSRDGLAVFRAKLEGTFDTPPRLRSWYRRRRHGAESPT